MVQEMAKQWGDGTSVAEIDQYESNLRIQESSILHVDDLARVVMEYTTYGIPIFSQTELLCADTQLRGMASDCVCGTVYLVRQDEKENGMLFCSLCSLLLGEQLPLRSMPRLRLPEIAKQCKRSLFAAHDNCQWLLFGNDVDWNIAFCGPSAEWRVLPRTSTQMVVPQQICYFPTCAPTAFGSRDNPHLAFVATWRFADIHYQSVHFYDLNANRWEMNDLHPRAHSKDYALVCVGGRLLFVYNAGYIALDCTNGVFQKLASSVPREYVGGLSFSSLTCVYDERTSILLAVGWNTPSMGSSALEFRVVAFQVLLSPENQMTLHLLSERMVSVPICTSIVHNIAICVGPYPGTLLLCHQENLHLVC